MKASQKHENDMALLLYSDAMHQLESENPVWKKFRTCTAQTCATTDYYILKSYDTIVAIVLKLTGTGCDVLRYNYEFTRTSAYHIAKFFQQHYVLKRYTYR